MVIIGKKELLEDAAYEVFKENGFKKTNVSQITKRAGMATGTFYNYFDSKESIFLSVYIKENDRLRASIQKNIQWESQPIEIIQQIFQLSLEAQKDNLIIREWYNSDSNQILKDYYSSTEGKEKFLFHAYLKDRFYEKLSEMNFSESEMIQVFNTYELIYDLDTKLNFEDTPHFYGTLQFLVENFIKGIMIGKE